MPEIAARREVVEVDAAAQHREDRVCRGHAVATGATQARQSAISRWRRPCYLLPADKRTVIIFGFLPGSRSRDSHTYDYLHSFVAVVVGGVLLVIPAIWVLVDVFLIPGMARASNNRLIERLNISRLRF